jgi:uncharacterized membrane protein
MFKKYFSAGLLLWLPLVITLWVIETIVRWSDSIVALLPPAWRPENILGFHIPGMGLVIGAVVIFLTGMLVANFIGKRLVHLWEWLIDKIPLVRPVYSGVKQIAATLLSDQTESFKEVVLIEYPQPGEWTYGFVVASPSVEAKQVTATPDLITVYVPTAPNPTSGYVLMVSRSRVRKTAATVDEAFKFHVSLGVVPPQEGNPPPAKTDSLAN